MSKDLVLIDGGANSELAQEIAKILGVSVHDTAVQKFNDGESGVYVREQVRGKNVFIVQPTSEPVNEHLMNLLILIDALKRGSAETITAVVPYFGYARQDRKDQPRAPITAKLVANLLTAAGATRVVTVDIHAHQIQGFFDIPLDHLYARNVLLERVKGLKDNLVVVSPDVGGAKMAEGFSERLGTPMAIIHKKRIDDKTTKAGSIVGDVHGKAALIVDDIIATAGSLCEGATALKKAGAQKVYAAITHGVLSGPAIERLEKSDIDTLFITNTIQQPAEKRIKKIEIVSVAPLLATAIRRINNNESVSELFRD